MNLSALSAVEPLLIAAKMQVAFCQCDSLYRQQFAINLDEQIKVLLNGGGEWVYLARAGPLDLHCRFRRQPYRMFFDRRGSAGNLNGLGCGAINGFAGKIVGAGEAPGIIYQD